MASTKRSKAAKKAARTRKLKHAKRVAAAKKAARTRKRAMSKRSAAARRGRSSAARRGRRRTRRVTVSLRFNGVKKGGAKKGGAKRGRAKRASAKRSASGGLAKRVSRLETRVGGLSREVQFQGARLRSFGMRPALPGIVSGRKLKLKKPISFTHSGHVLGSEEQRLAAKYNPFGRRARKHRRTRRHGRR